MLDFFNKLEYKYGKYAVRNLNVYLAAIYLVGLIIMTLDPSYYYMNLSLDIVKILHGQVWRIITFIFYPPLISYYMFLSLLSIYIYYSLSRSLLMIWSDFKFQMYIICGMLGHFLGGLLIHLITGQNVILTPDYLTFSIFIAFALSFPDSVFLIFFILPVKAKYLGYLELILYFISFITGDLNTKIAIACSLINVFIFLYVTYKYDVLNLFRILKNKLGR